MRFGTSLVVGLAASLLAATGSVAQSNGEDQAPLGLNLGGNSYYSPEYAFKNLAANAGRWRAQEIGKPFSWDYPLPEMTEHGYPKTVPEGYYLETFLVGTSGERRSHLGDRLIVLYEGTGEITYAHGGKLLEREPGRDLLDISGDGSVTMELRSTDPKDPVRNIRVVVPENEADLADAEPGVIDQPFREEFLERWEGFVAFRFMDWQHTNNNPMVSWDERPLPTDYNQTDEKGIALEYQIALCNEAGVDGWFCVPHLADDEYVRNMAELIKAELEPERKVYIEYSNEVWNGQFQQARHAAEQGQEEGLSDNRFQGQLFWYSKRSCEIFDIFSEVFADDEDRLVRVLSAQSANPWTSRQVLEYQDAHEKADALAIAPYFGGGLINRDNVSERENWSLDELFAAVEEDLAETAETMKEQSAVAEEFGVELLAYEAGQHLAGHGGIENNQAVTDLYIAANRDPRMGELYERYLQAWNEADGGLMMIFSSMYRPSKWGSWGLLEYESQDPATAPKLKAVREYLDE